VPRKLLLVAGLLSASPAWADHPAFPDSPKAQQGLAQYDNLELEAALTLLVDAAKDTKLAKEQRALILIYAGMVAMTLPGRGDEAKEHFGEAVDLDPKVKFPPDEASPKIAQALEDVRKAKVPDLTAPVVKPPPDTSFAETGREEPGQSRLPIILAGGGAVVVIAAVVVVLVFALKGNGCAGPSGTGCVDVHPSGARQ